MSGRNHSGSCAAAGVAITDVTPARGVELGGYPHFPRHNTGANDPLYASCLYLECGGEAAAVVGVDSLFISRLHVEEIRKTINEKTGIKRENINVCCSHSHSSPNCAGRLDRESLLNGDGQDAGYVSELKEKITQTVISATRTAFKCSVGYGAAFCGPEVMIGGNRRDPEKGHSDPTVRVLSVRDAKGGVRCVLSCYSVHPTILHEDSTVCSADYPGYIRERLRELYPRAVSVFTLGCAGDQSSRYFRRGQSFDEAERFGRTIADAAALAANSAEYKDSFGITVKSAAFEPKLRTLPPYEAALAKMERKRALYEKAKDGGAPYLEVQNANLALLGAEDLLGYAEVMARGESLSLDVDEKPYEVTLAGFGDTSMLFLPGEVFMGVAKRIRERSLRKNLIIATVSNGCLPGYLYTKEDEAYGGYEVDTSLLDPSAADAITEAALYLINEKITI